MVTSILLSTLLLLLVDVRLLKCNAESTAVAAIQYDHCVDLSPERGYQLWWKLLDGDRIALKLQASVSS
jgi:hypothetical protein